MALWNCVFNFNFYFLLLLTWPDIQQFIDECWSWYSCHSATPELSMSFFVLLIAHYFLTFIIIIIKS